jgi:hypothetical protein
MDFHALLAKMKQIDQAPAAPIDQTTEDCGMMPTSMPTPSRSETPPPSHPSMSVNLNAQGMDNIEQMMKLFQKVNPDMMPKISPAPALTTIPSISPVKPEIPALKMLPDFDADNDNKVGGEIDMEIEPMDKPKSSMTPMDLPKDHDEDHNMIKTLDRDGDGDHDMDDHEMEPDDDSDSDDDSNDGMPFDDEPKKEDGGFQNATTEPEEKFSGIDYMNNKLAGGMNKPHGTYPKVASGDNPMQKVKEIEEDSFRASIRADLMKRLNEAKGVK